MKIHSVIGELLLIITVIYAAPYPQNLQNQQTSRNPQNSQTQLSSKRVVPQGDFRETPILTPEQLEFYLKSTGTTPGGGEGESLASVSNRRPAIKSSTIDDHSTPQSSKNNVPAFTPTGFSPPYTRWVSYILIKIGNKFLLPFIDFIRGIILNLPLLFHAF